MSNVAAVNGGMCNSAIVNNIAATGTYTPAVIPIFPERWKGWEMPFQISIRILPRILLP